MIKLKYVGVFQGGGVKGIAHIGALKALEERGFSCDKAAGTSVGAIIASLVISGYTSDEMLDMVENLNLTNLREKGRTINSIRELGLYSSRPLLEYLDFLYKQKKVSTYLDVKKGNDYRLKVVGTNITKRKQIIFPNDLKYYNINPDNFKISTSVVMSATYPFFYKPFKINNNLIMDGSIANNFPLDVFEPSNSTPIIGFNIVGENAKRMYHNCPYIIRIIVPRIRTMDFRISKTIKEDLYLTGYQAGLKFLNNFFINK